MLFRDFIFENSDKKLLKAAEKLIIKMKKEKADNNKILKALEVNFPSLDAGEVLANFKNNLAESLEDLEGLSESESSEKTLKNITAYLKTLGLDISGFEFKPDGKFTKDMRVHMNNTVKKDKLLNTLFSEMYVDIAFGYDENGGGAIKLHYKWETNDGSSNGIRMIKRIRNSKIELSGR